MIVYAGKQFGNDFNNGDEALFEDAGLPRDSNKFKIQQGIQARKQDLRTANSGIAAQGLFKSAKLQSGQSVITWNTAKMKSSYTASDFSDINGFVATDGSVLSAETIADGMYRNEKGIKENPIIGKPYVNPVDGDIVIGKSGLYSITCQCIFIAPTGYSVSSSYNYKFYVALMLNGKASMWTQARGCGSTDALSVSLTARFDLGDKVNTGFLHTYTTKAFVCQPSICLYRLS